MNLNKTVSCSVLESRVSTTAFDLTKGTRLYVDVAQAVLFPLNDIRIIVDSYIMSKLSEYQYGVTKIA